MHDRDRRAREADPGIQRLDRGIVPGLDLALEDAGECRPVELQPGLDAGQVVGDRDSTERDWELEDRSLAGLDLRRLLRRITAGEVNGAGLQLRDSGARAHTVVVDGQTLGLEVRSPLLVDRGSERGARTVDRSRAA